MAEEGGQVDGRRPGHKTGTQIHGPVEEIHRLTALYSYLEGTASATYKQITMSDSMTSEADGVWDSC